LLLWGNDHEAHKPCEDNRGSGRKKETADLCNVDVPQFIRCERDNNVRILAESQHVTIAETPIIEAAELEKRDDNDPHSIEYCYQLS